MGEIRKKEWGVGGVRTAIIVCGLFFCVFSQGEGDAIAGKWLTEKGLAAFEFYRIGCEYRARLIVLNNTDSKDTNNPVDSLKRRKLNGAVLINGLYYDDNKKQWTNGKIYNPQDGKTYECYCTLKPGGEYLLFRGYLGVKIFGKNQTWKRVTSEKEGNHLK